MSSKNSSGKVGVIIRILELFTSYKELNAGKILKKLVSEGYLKPSSRRLLNYYLEELEKLGILELKGKGRGAKWILKKSFLNGGSRMEDEQKALIFLSLLSLPDFMGRELEGEIASVLRKLGYNPEMVKTLGRDLHTKYLYGVSPSHQLQKLSKILNAINGKQYIYIERKNDSRKLLPVGVALRKGKLYLTAIDKDGKRKTFALERITNVTVLDKVYGGKHFPEGGFYATFDDREKAFIFGIELNKEIPLGEEHLEFSPLVFHHEIENGTLKRLYLVGFTGEYFASRFALFIYGKLIPPNAEMLELARKKRLNNLFPNLELGNAEENLERYTLFVKNLEKQLSKRLELVRQSLSELENIKTS